MLSYSGTEGANIYFLVIPLLLLLLPIALRVLLAIFKILRNSPGIVVTFTTNTRQWLSRTLNNSINAQPHPPLLFDPVCYLPEDVAAFCFSFLDSRSLLDTVQHVSHAWHKAVGSRAVWRDVRLPDTSMTNAGLVEIVRKSRGATNTLRGLDASDMSEWCLQACFHTLSHLRVLKITPYAYGSLKHLGPLLSHLPLLEDLSVKWYYHSLRFPHLPFLRSVKCHYGGSKLKCLYNLPSLTKLDVRECSVDTSHAWPASLRHISISYDEWDDTNVFNRVASLHQLESLHMDLSFCYSLPELSFLSSLTSLQHFSIHSSGLAIASNVQGSLASLRKLNLHYSNVTDEQLQRIANLPNLQDLSIRFAPLLTNNTLRLICTTLPNLSKLHLFSCDNITDYSYLPMCGTLRELCIAHSKKKRIALAQIKAISNMQQLVSLTLWTYLFNTGVDIFSYLRNMRGLQELTLRIQNGRYLFLDDELYAMWFFSLLWGERANWMRSGIVECLSHMPNMTCVTLPHNSFLSTQGEAMLIAALPRINVRFLAETLDAYSALEARNRLN